MRNKLGQFIKGHLQSNTGKTHIKKGQHLSIETEFQTGQLATNWNGFKKGCKSGHRFQKGSTPWNKGKHYMQKEKHWNWKGGKATEQERKRKTKRTYHCRRRTWEENGGKLTVKIIQLVYEDNIKQFGTLTCYLCFNPIEFGKDTIDHKIPLSKKGTNNYANLAIACRSCNCKKNVKTLAEYGGKNGMDLDSK